MALSRKPDINQLDNFVQMMSLGCPRLLPSRLKKNVFGQCSWVSTKRAKVVFSLDFEFIHYRTRTGVLCVRGSS